MNAAEQVLLVWAYALLALVMLGALWAVVICAAEFHREGLARVRQAEDRDRDHEELMAELRAKLSGGKPTVLCDIVRTTPAIPTQRSLR